MQQDAHEWLRGQKEEFKATHLRNRATQSQHGTNWVDIAHKYAEERRGRLLEEEQH